MNDHETPKPPRMRIKVRRHPNGITAVNPRFDLKNLSLTLLGVAVLSFAAVIVYGVEFSGSRVNHGFLDLLFVRGIACLFVLVGLMFLCVYLPLFFQKNEVTIHGDTVHVLRCRVLSNRRQKIPLVDIESFAVAKSRGENTEYDLLADMVRGPRIPLLLDRPKAEMQWVSGELIRATQTLEPESTPDQRVLEKTPEMSLGQLRAATSDSHFLPNQESDLEEDVQGVVQCKKCDSAYRASEMQTECRNCGGPLELEDAVSEERKLVVAFKPLEKLLDLSHVMDGSDQLMFNVASTTMRELLSGTVICGFCDTTYSQRPDSPNCPSCGGVLPPPPSSALGPSPPEASRRLPFRFIYRLMTRRNRAGVIGIIFWVASLAAFPWYPVIATGGIVFTSIICFFAFFRRVLRLIALRYGTAVPGQIETVHALHSDSYPVYRMYYRFSIDGAPMRSIKWSYSPSVASHYVGEPVWVLVRPSMPKASDLWPPFN